MTRVAPLFAFALLAGCGGAVQASHGIAARAPRVDVAADEPAATELPAAAKRIAVPGFDGATAWLNVDHPLTLAELRGRVVLVDFWTSCCINCLHTLPKLAKLEARFRGRPFVVVGVQSPKFDEEKDADRLRAVLGSERIEHPIAVDGDMAIWHAWGVEGWPTLALLDADGKAFWAASGEPDEGEVGALVEAALDEARSAGKLATRELVGVRPEPTEPTPLRYPGKVLALAGGGLAIADTGHDRVVVTDASGQVTAVVGSAPGHADGDFAKASFRHPEGLAELDGALYVADTGNHLLRRIDRAARTVSTVAGTGALGTRPLHGSPEPARQTALRSPWDVVAFRGEIVVALAGSHQIAAFHPGQGTIRLVAGTGEEARKDGPVFDAAFAQPSALATDGKRLFVLDSESSSVRAIELGMVRTIVGEDLFVFGDVDGSAKKARLQHPLGLAWADGALWVADTYNGKLKRVDPIDGTTRTIVGGLGEPAGLSARDGALFVADTNRHRIARVALGGTKVEPIPIAGLDVPSPTTSARLVDPRDPVAPVMVRLASGVAKLHLAWAAPPGTAVNDAAPLRLTWVEQGGLARMPAASGGAGAAFHDGIDVALEAAAGAGAASLTGVLDLVACDVAKHEVCLPVRRTVRVEVAWDGDRHDATATVALPDAVAAARR